MVSKGTGADGNRGPENLAEVLGRLFTSRGWARKTERVKLEEAWAAVAGPDAAPHSRPGSLRRGVLEVEVRGGVLLQELAQFRKRQLLAGLRLALPGQSITDLRFRSGTW